MNNILSKTKQKRKSVKGPKQPERIKEPVAVLSYGKSESATTKKRMLKKSKQLKKKKYGDFSEFFGIWTKEEAEEFERNTAAFEEIDEEIWQK